MTGDPGFIIGETPCCSDGDGVVHTDVYIFNDGRDLISTWLRECTPSLDPQNIPAEFLWLPVTTPFLVTGCLLTMEQRKRQLSLFADFLYI